LEYGELVSLKELSEVWTAANIPMKQLVLKDEGFL